MHWLGGSVVESGAVVLGQVEKSLPVVETKAFVDSSPVVDSSSVVKPPSLVLCPPVELFGVGLVGSSVVGLDG